MVHGHFVCRARVCKMVAALLMTTFKLSTVRALLEEHWKKEHSTTLKNDYHVRAAFLGSKTFSVCSPRLGCRC